MAAPQASYLAPSTYPDASTPSFPPSFAYSSGAATAPALSPVPVVPLAELERQAIMRALEYTKGDRLTAASLLGIGRTTLYRKLKEYELGEEA